MWMREEREGWLESEEKNVGGERYLCKKEGKGEEAGRG